MSEYPQELLDGRVTFDPPVPLLQRDLEAYEGEYLPRIAEATTRGPAYMRRQVLLTAIKLGWLRGLAGGDLETLAAWELVAVSAAVQSYVQQGKVPKGS